jgi:hypothetical protein
MPAADSGSAAPPTVKGLWLDHPSLDSMCYLLMQTETGRTFGDERDGSYWKLLGFVAQLAVML